MTPLQLATSITVVAAMLGIGAGLAKLWSPHTAVAAMRSVGLPSNATVVRLGSLAEGAVAVGALVSPSWIPRALLALSYGALALFVAALLRAGVATDCGCFGTGGGPTGRRHLVLDAALCVGAAASVFRTGAITASMRPTSTSGVAALLVAAMSALLATTYVSHERAS